MRWLVVRRKHVNREQDMDAIRTTSITLRFVSAHLRAMYSVSYTPTQLRKRHSTQMRSANTSPLGTSELHAKYDHMYVYSFFVR